MVPDLQRQYRNLENNKIKLPPCRCCLTVPLELLLSQKVLDRFSPNLQDRYMVCMGEDDYSDLFRMNR